MLLDESATFLWNFTGKTELQNKSAAGAAGCVSYRLALEPKTYRISPQPVRFGAIVDRSVSYLIYEKVILFVTSYGVFHGGAC
jgi:hypothetical protein